MNEERFRTLIREAVGEEPMPDWLATAVRSRIAQPQSTASRARWIALLAACVAFALIAIAIVPRVLPSTRPVVPGSTPPPTATPNEIDPANCTLPILLATASKDFLSTSTVGFVHTSTGQFSTDASASPSVAGLPTDSVDSIGTPGPPQALSYSPAARRWLPVAPDRISPDGLSYAYLQRTYPPGPGATPSSQLWRYDITTGKRTHLWSVGIEVYPIKWTASGILVPDQLAGGHRWVVDPVTGAATELGLGTSGLFVPLSGDPHGTDGTGFHGVGLTAAGQTIWWIFNLDKPRAADWVFYETAPGKRVYIYKGTQGDSTGFNPDAAFADITGIWFSSYRVAPLVWHVWHWDAVRGLRRVDANGLTAKTVIPVPAGPCF